MWSALGVVLLVAVGIAGVATVVLALGTLLAHLFAVTTFEASVVVLLVAAAGVLLGRAVLSFPDDGLLVEAEDDALPVVLRTVPLPRRRPPRRRKQ